MPIKFKKRFQNFTLFKNYIKNIPKGLQAFLVKAVVLIIVWKLTYHLYLKPHRFPDKPLTEITASATAHFMSLFYPASQNISWFSLMPSNNFDYFSAIITIDGRKVVGIADPCNALELYVLYISFLLCVPTTLKRALLFSAGGIIAIFILNVFRCSAMIWVNLNHREALDFAHHYLFKLIVYAGIFVGWVWYSKKLNNSE